MTPSSPVIAYASARDVEVTAALEEAIDSALSVARARWPGLSIDASAFARFLAERLGPEEIGGAAVTDLYLAAGALAGDRAALTAFEELLAQVPAWVRRRADAPIVDELKQRLRAELLVGPSAQLGGYRGRGALHAWLRISATRLLWRLESAGAREIPHDESAAITGGGGGAGASPERVDPERALLGQHATPVVTRAVERALASLEARPRLLLRLRYGDGLTDEKIGRMYSVHQSTATRWLAAAHAALAEEVRRQVVAELRLREDEVDSVLGAVQSRIDLSLGALLRSRNDGA